MRIRVATTALAGLALVAGQAHAQGIPELYGGKLPKAAEPAVTPVPSATCGAGSRPEPGLQGRVPAGSDDGYRCNAELLATEGATGGFRVERYVDRAGRECAYYDTALIVPANLPGTLAAGLEPGVAVIDMTDPRKPARTATLTTPAMQSPHESLRVHQGRGLLAAALGTLATAPGIVDVYDLSEDCRRPRLLSSTNVGVLGHESGWSGDGNTFYVTSVFAGIVTAVDLRDPGSPRALTTVRYPSHGMSVSEDGRRGFLAGLRGLEIVDLSQVQDRAPRPEVPRVAGLSWTTMSIPQNAEPITIKGRPYLLETDEFSYDDNDVVTTNGPNAGAARLIDISDERNPRVVSNLRLAVHQREHRAAVAGDPGNRHPGQGYAAHYCGVPRTVDPEIVACSFINSGLRVFDVRDPERPKEIAYFVGPPKPSFGIPGATLDPHNWAMSRPAFDPETGDIWYSDANAGLYVVRLTNGVWPQRAAEVAGLPSAADCLSRRVFTIRLRARRGTLRSATVRIDGRRTAVRRRGGRLTARIDLRGRKRTTVVVRVVGRTTSGRTVRETRRYRTCTPRRAAILRRAAAARAPRQDARFVPPAVQLCILAATRPPA